MMPPRKKPVARAIDEEFDSTDPTNGYLFRFFEERDRRYAELALAESKRIDAVMGAEARRVDALFLSAANLVGVASTRAENTAQTLAERVEATAKTAAISAEALAKALAEQTAATAKTAVDAIAAVREELSNRIAPLEAARYVQAGRSGLSTPLIATMAALAGGVVLWIIEHLMMAK